MECYIQVIIFPTTWNAYLQSNLNSMKTNSCRTTSETDFGHLNWDFGPLELPLKIWTRPHKFHTLGTATIVSQDKLFWIYLECLDIPYLLLLSNWSSTSDESHYVTPVLCKTGCINVSRNRLLSLVNMLTNQNNCLNNTFIHIRWIRMNIVIVTYVILSQIRIHVYFL